MYYRYIITACTKQGCYKDASVEVVNGSSVMPFCMEHAEPYLDSIDKESRP